MYPPGFLQGTAPAAVPQPGGAASIPQPPGTALAGRCVPQPPGVAGVAAAIPQPPGVAGAAFAAMPPPGFPQAGPATGVVPNMHPHGAFIGGACMPMATFGMAASASSAVPGSLMAPPNAAPLL